MYVFAAKTINLQKGWTDFWGGLKSGAGINSLLNLLTVIGALIIVAAIVKMLWDKARGQGGGGMGGGGGKNNLVWAIVFGALLAGPEVIVPAILVFIDAIVNAMAKVVTNVGGG